MTTILNVNIRSLGIIKIILGPPHKYTILKETYTFWTSDLGSINLKVTYFGNQVLLYKVPLTENNQKAKIHLHLWLIPTFPSSYYSLDKQKYSLDSVTYLTLNTQKTDISIGAHQKF